MTKKFITGADVLRALAAGKKVRSVNTENEIGVYSGYTTGFFYNHEFEIVEKPATDAELVAEMRRRASTTTNEANWAFDECADMLEKRSIKP